MANYMFIAVLLVVLSVAQGFQSAFPNAPARAGTALKMEKDTSQYTKDNSFFVALVEELKRRNPEKWAPKQYVPPPSRTPAAPAPSAPVSAPAPAASWAAPPVSAPAAAPARHDQPWGAVTPPSAPAPAPAAAPASSWGNVTPPSAPAPPAAPSAPSAPASSGSSWGESGVGGLY